MKMLCKRLSFVMPALAPGIHVSRGVTGKTAGTGPVMTD
jgi:hypothetical protein